MNYKFYFLALFLLLGCATNKTSSPDASSQSSANETVILDHKFFQIAYNTQRRLASYVTYQLKATNLKNKTAKRKDKFIPDPILIKSKIPYVVVNEYNRTGYDRGHLAPSADFSWSEEANDATFVMSNMVPQTPNLNRDAWKRLEDQVRKWACGEEEITVISGPVLRPNLPKLPSGLEIPQEFFKIIIDETPPQKMISFIYHQEDRGNLIAKRVVPVSKIEVATGLALSREFPNLVRRPASIDEWKECD